MVLSNKNELIIDKYNYTDKHEKEFAVLKKTQYKCCHLYESLDQVKQIYGHIYQVAFGVEGEKLLELTEYGMRKYCGTKECSIPW